MPVISTSSGLVLLAALLPVAAAPIALSPGEVTAYTLAGALVAAFLAVAYMRIKSPAKQAYWSLAFTVVSTIAVGWLVPEPLAWAAVRMGKLTAADVETLPRQMWAAAGLFWGMSGTTTILTSIYWIQKKLPSLLLSEEVATVQLPDGALLEIKHTKAAQPETPAPPAP